MHVVDSLRQDAAYALRGLRRSPGFTLIVMLCMAVGVGGTIATVAILDRLLFQSPAGVVDPGSLRRLGVGERLGGHAASDRRVFSVPDTRDLAASALGLGGVEGYSTVPDRVLGEGDGPRVTLSYVTQGFLPMLGVRPAQGRLFADDEGELQPREVTPAVISYDIWRRAFAEDPTILGQQLTVSGLKVTVVGVAARGFQGLDLEPVDIWVPLSARMITSSEQSWVNNRGARFLPLVVRLAPGHQWSELLGRLTTAYARAHADDPLYDRSPRLSMKPLLQARSQGLSAVQERGLSLTKRLTAVAAAVLALTAVNVGILLLMRFVRRRNEIAVRLALGMSRARLIRQLLVESVILAVGAGGLALLVGWWGSAFLRARLLSTIRWPAAGMDERIVILAALLAAVVGFGAGLVPALAARRYSANALRLDAASVDPRGTRLRVRLLATQIAFCVVLIAFSGAFLQSLRRVEIDDFGFDADRLAMIQARLGGAGAMEEIMREVQRLPFVTSVANATSDVAPDRQRGAFAVGQRDSVPEAQWPSFNLVGADYFKTAGLRMLRGRPLGSEDIAGSERVVVITESLAKEFWRGRDPIGDCVFAFGNFITCRRIVGVVRDVRWDITGEPIPHFYAPLAQAGRAGGRYWLVRVTSKLDAAQLQEMNRIIQSASGTTPVAAAYGIASLIEPQLSPLRGASTLLMAFGALALLLAATGAYGLMASEIAQRTRELGIRLAMGASERDVVQIILSSGVRVVATGIAAGLVGTFLCGRLISAFLVDTAPYDPVVLILVVVTIVVSSLLAMLPTAIRASRLDPATVLRHDG